MANAEISTEAADDDFESVDGERLTSGEEGDFGRDLFSGEEIPCCCCGDDEDMNVVEADSDAKLFVREKSTESCIIRILVNEGRERSNVFNNAELVVSMLLSSVLMSF